MVLVQFFKLETDALCEAPSEEAPVFAAELFGRWQNGRMAESVLLDPKRAGRTPETPGRNIIKADLDSSCQGASAGTDKVPKGVC